MRIEDLQPHDDARPQAKLPDPLFVRGRRVPRVPQPPKAAPVRPPPKPRKPRSHSGRVGGDRSEIVAELPLACTVEAAAVEFMERQRWGDTPCCPRCGDTDVRKMLDANGNRNSRFLWRCLGCRKQFTVRIGAVYEESRIPLRHWCFAYWASCASKKGVSAMQIKRQTGLNYRSALFLLNRIRHAVARTPAPDGPRMSGTVEVDEVFIGGRVRKESAEHRSLHRGKTPVVAVVERGGAVHAMPVANVTGANLRRVMMQAIEPGTRIITDDRHSYRSATRGLGPHEFVRHSFGEYKRPGTDIHTNAAEGFFSLLRRKLDGTHHAVSRKHLHRYVSEACFIYSNRDVDDGERVRRAIQASSGKRMTYRQAVA
jgi:transposase-like protein